MSDWQPRYDKDGIKQTAIESGAWIICKTFHPEPLYTLWRGSARIDNYATAEMAKAAAAAN